VLHASEARKIVEMSDANVTAFLEKLAPLIREKAEKGERELRPSFLDGVHNDTPISGEQGKPKPVPTKLIELVMKRLKDHGYSAEWIQFKEYTHTCGFGCSHDEREPVKVATFGLSIRW
jgi:hypothetical protein